jgi:hypothetical protein
MTTVDVPPPGYSGKRVVLDVPKHRCPVCLATCQPKQVKKGRTRDVLGRPPITWGPIAEILQNSTDDTHPKTVKEITYLLRLAGVDRTADRVSRCLSQAKLRGEPVARNRLGWYWFGACP